MSDGIWPVARPSGVEGPGRMVLTSSGWVRQVDLGGPDAPDVDLSRWSTDEVVKVFQTASGDLRSRAAEELANRLAQATGSD